MRTVSERPLAIRSTAESIRISGGQKHIAIIIPGIRTNADWVSTAQTASWKRWQRERMATLPLDYRITSDRRIPTAVLITRFGLKKRCENITLQINDIIHKNPGSKISIIVHSLGSDILTHILPSINYTFDHIVFLGALCKSNRVLTLNNSAIKFLNSRGTYDPWPVAASLIRPDKYYPTGTFGFGLGFVREIVSNNDHSSCTDAKYVLGTVEDYIQTGSCDIADNFEISFDSNKFYYFKWALYSYIFLFLSIAIYCSVFFGIFVSTFILLFLLSSVILAVYKYLKL